jgi:thiol-disulfide isomerase/thioredoxin
MKKYINLISLLLIIAISYFIYIRFNKKSEIPVFEYKTTDNSTYSNNDIANSEKKIVFIYFSCNCEDCKELINNIPNYKTLQNNNQFILVTTEKKLAKIKEFVNLAELNKLKIPVLIDENNNFPSDFGLGISIDLPKIIVFNKNKYLIKELNSIEDIKHIRNN